MPSSDADQRAERGEFKRRGKDAADVLGDRLCRQDRLAEIAVEHLADIDRKLMPERLVESHGDTRLLVDVGSGIVADDGQHRINRDDARDQERDQQQPKDRDGDRRQLAAEHAHPAQQARRADRQCGNGGCESRSPYGGPQAFILECARPRAAAAHSTRSTARGSAVLQTLSSSRSARRSWCPRSVR